jgi:hypothetical protein
MLCFALLCHAMLLYGCYDMLCYAMLCYAFLCFAVLCYAVLCSSVLCCAVLCCAVLCCTVDIQNCPNDKVSAAEGKVQEKSPFATAAPSAYGTYPCTVTATAVTTQPNTGTSIDLLCAMQPMEEKTEDTSQLGVHRDSAL